MVISVVSEKNISFLVKGSPHFSSMFSSQSVRVAKMAEKSVTTSQQADSEILVQGDFLFTKLISLDAAVEFGPRSWAKY